MAPFPRLENKHSKYKYKYDVFPSFRGEDKCKNFVDHLHDHLRRRGLVAFRDDHHQDLSRGKCIKPEILRAIEHVWKKLEVAKAVECKDINEGLVIPIFYEVNPSDIRKLRGNFGTAFAKIEEAYSDDKRDIKRWKDAVSDLVRMHSHVANVVESLCLDGSDVRSIGIWGMGGIGKTTVAQAVYDKIHGQFDDGCCFLADVREISENGLVYLQNQFLGDILQDNNLRIRDDHRGVNMIKQRLQHQKFLVILDDVDEKEQLKKLIGGFDWFGHGSRIIITTRDEHFLFQYGVNSIYIRSNHPLVEFNELVKQIIGYVDGLPLALDVLGSFLACRSLMQWKSALTRLKECLEGKIFYWLRLSYDGLRQKENEIFLDIACFFKGKEKPYVVEVLDNCDLYADIGIEILVNKSLIQIVGNKLWMHDLLQEMVWEIVRRESPKEPGERIVYQGTGKIKAIVLQYGDHRTMRLNGESFTNMNNLRLLDIRAIHLYSGFKHLSNELCLLRWDNCSLKSFPPSFLPKSLVQLHMQDSLICSLWRGEKVGIRLSSLTKLDLSGCSLLEGEIPNDIDCLPSLRSLDLAENLFTTLTASIEHISGLKFSY
ncbi:hypothetical protein EUGRSUZ_F01319 [Eucalyptus grandis]|uniref:Uncharacterized protein n=2 Tax=Eucalyptus grandis TaxID=71139 RepID=A0ACC3KDI5_EUCGR|nr:hypothetical protein EUGRSUZ_F01319 [Eucalyptus grandis]